MHKNDKEEFSDAAVQRLLKSMIRCDRYFKLFPLLENTKPWYNNLRNRHTYSECQKGQKSRQEIV